MPYRNKQLDKVNFANTEPFTGYGYPTITMYTPKYGKENENEYKNFGVFGQIKRKDGHLREGDMSKCSASTMAITIWMKKDEVPQNNLYLEFSVYPWSTYNNLTTPELPPVAIEPLPAPPQKAPDTRYIGIFDYEAETSQT